MADRISNLPEPLLLQILSSLEIKEAIATSLLSKRWRFLWRNLPNLEFDDSSFCRLKSFLQFVDGTLLLIDLKSVQKFVLKLEDFPVPPVRVNIWLNALLSHNSITYLEVHNYNAMLPLPSRVFTCSTISVLKLRGFLSNVSTFDLPSLKVLHLWYIQFSDSECVDLIFSNCLHLEELVLRCVGITRDHLSIDVGRLEHLLCAYVPAYLFAREAFSNVQFLRYSEEFGSWHPWDEFDFPTFHNLIHLEIDKFYCYCDWMVVSDLQCFPKLQSLVIHQHFRKLSYDEWGLGPAPDVPPCVSCHLKEFVVLGFKGSKNEFEFVRFIMENAKVLRTVIVWSAAKSEREGFEMFKKISSYAICSAKCRLFFDVSKESVEEAMRKCLTIRKLYAIPSYENFMF